MIKRAIGVVPGSIMFIYLVASVERVSASKIVGIVAFTIAFGSICFVAIASPYGFQRRGHILGKEVEYLVPVPTMPSRLGLAIIASTVVLAIAAFGLFLLGH